MFRKLVAARSAVAMIVAAGVGACGLHGHPLPSDDPFLALIALQNSSAFRVLAFGYAALWFTTPFFAASLCTSVVAIVASTLPGRPRSRPLPMYPPPEKRATPFLILGEAHALREPGPAPEPKWLVIPQRGLYTGVMVLGAVGTGKTSACMYPYVDQLLRWRAEDAERRVGGLVMEVKGDFCRQVRGMLTAAGRSEDYVEIGLDSDISYNPLHN